jgi:hypothetical protein
MEDVRMLSVVRILPQLARTAGLSESCLRAGSGTLLAQLGIAASFCSCCENNRSAGTASASTRSHAEVGLLRPARLPFSPQGCIRQGLADCYANKAFASIVVPGNGPGD